MSPSGVDATPSRPAAVRAPVLGIAAFALLLGAAIPAAAQEDIAAKVATLAPRLDAYIEAGMKAFDNPGLAIGIVSGDRLVYARGFGVKRKGGSDAVDTKTVFQIGSTTKAFLATTMAIAVDGKKFAWDDRVVDRLPAFQMRDPWVSNEFRLFDLLAQRSGMPPYANDVYGMLGASDDQKIHSLRFVDPVSSFRSTFAYTNITHIVAGRIVAAAMGAADWDAVVTSEIFEPLGMTDTSLTADAIEAAPNRTWGHRYAASGTVEVPFTPIFPYGFGGAGAINSTVEDLARWVRLLLADGAFEGKRIVSAENLAVTRMARVAVGDKANYAMGWVNQQTPNGQITWHNGGTTAYGAYIGLVRDRGFAVVVLTNETNVGFPDAIGEWTLDRLMGNPEVDYVAAKLKSAVAADEDNARLFTPPANPRPAPALAALTGAFANPVFGKVAVSQSGDSLLLTLAETGAALKLDPWDGDIFTVSVVPEGRFAAMAANLGPGPIGFAQFQIDRSGVLNRIQMNFAEDIQTHVFARAE